MNTTIALSPIKNASDLDEATRRAFALRDAPEGSMEHDEHLMLLDLIEAYEARHHPMPQLSGSALLKHCMEADGLSQRQLPEIGPQSVVSEILNGKRSINARQAVNLAVRFKLTADAFLR